MSGQSNGHRWDARRTALVQALVRHHKVGEADHKPALSPMAHAAPGQPPRAAPRGRDQPPQGAIPPFHKGCLDRLSEVPAASRLAQTARATVHPPPADLHDLACLVANLDPLRVKQRLWRHESRLRLAPHVPPTPGTIHDAHDLKQCRGVGLPPIREK
jgi:hypothetical protein